MNKETCIRIREATLHNLRLLAKKTGRNITGDLIDDLILLGIEEYRRAAGDVLFCNLCGVRESHAGDSGERSDADDRETEKNKKKENT